MTALVLLFLLGAVVAVVAGSMRRGAGRAVLVGVFVGFAALVLIGGVMYAIGAGASEQIPTEQHTEAPR
jgi:hypothetical protein